jgi:hypothetical protein
MSYAQLNPYELKILRLADKGIVRRRWYGWPIGFGTWHRAIDVQGLVDLGYVKFFYDWGFDTPCLKITSLGRACLYDPIPDF